MQLPKINANLIAIIYLKLYNISEMICGLVFASQ